MAASSSSKYTTLRKEHSAHALTRTYWVLCICGDQGLRVRLLTIPCGTSAPGSHELSSEFLAGERLQRPRRWQVRLPHPVAVELRVSRAPHRLQLQRSSMRRVTEAVSLARARAPPVSERRGVASCGFRKRSKYSKDIRCPSVRPLLGSLLLPARRGCSSHDSSPRLRDRASRGFPREGRNPRRRHPSASAPPLPPSPGARRQRASKEVVA